MLWNKLTKWSQRANVCMMTTSWQMVRKITSSNCSFTHWCTGAWVIYWHNPPPPPPNKHILLPSWPVMCVLSWDCLWPSTTFSGIERSVSSMTKQKHFLNHALSTRTNNRCKDRTFIDAQNQKNVHVLIYGDVFIYNMFNLTREGNAWQCVHACDMWAPR